MAGRCFLSLDFSLQIVGALGPAPDAAGEELDWTTAFVFYQGVWTVFSTRQPSRVARAISLGGIVVGSDEDLRSETATEDPWVWQNGASARLPELAVGSGRASGFNQYGTIVGYSSTPSGDTHAVLWRQ
jgi:probable HAF family extracellular repeat protein